MLGRRSLVPWVLLVCLLPLVFGCASRGSLLVSVAGTPARLSPNGDRVDDTTAIAYALSRPARVSVYLLDERAQRYSLHENLARPAGSYETPFDGAVATAAGAPRQVVPAGEYRYVVEAVDEAGHREQREGRLSVSDADTAPPKLDNVFADPTEISPYDPQLSAQTRISYRLTEQATVTLFVDEADGRRTRLSEPTRQGPGEFSHVWDGLIRNKVPQAGAYGLVVQAKDGAGNTVEGKVQVAISGTEEPDATVVRVAFSPRQVLKGDLVKVEITVRNTGNVVLRSHGPEPGHIYTTLDTFASIEGGRYADKAHLWRVGVDWAGGLGAEGARYPYRWGLGKDLKPGEETTVVGYIRVMEDFPRLRFYAGLLHEKVKYHVDKVGQQLIEVGH